MDLSVIIVSWKVKDKLRENLKSLYCSTGNFSYEIFVVDNNSGDGTVEMVKDEFPKVILIANGENLGFAKANNQAIKLSAGRYVLLLNPDMRVMPDALTNMLNWMDSKMGAGVAGCRLINEAGNTIQHIRRFPEFFGQLAIVLKLPHIFPGLLDKYLRADFDYGHEASVDSIRGSFFMVRREVLNKVGLLDERFFIWFEEVDYCRRVKEAGFKVYYTPIAQCVDLVGQSFSQVKRGTTQKYFRDSMLKYFRKWHPVWQSALLSLAWPAGELIALLGDKLNFQSRAKT